MRWIALKENPILRTAGLHRIPSGCRLGTDVFDSCELVYIYGVAGSDAEDYCRTHGNCVFMEEGQN